MGAGVNRNYLNQPQIPYKIDEGGTGVVGHHSYGNRYSSRFYEEVPRPLLLRGDEAR